MLGGSAYFTDVYLVYYGINVTDFQSVFMKEKRKNDKVFDTQENKDFT
jgi:hypothetical protein